MVTDADRLVAAGRELTIAGHLFHVKYTPRSLKMLEDEYGSVQGIGNALGGEQGKVIGPLFFILSLGLCHERVDDVAVDEDWLLDNCEIQDIHLYDTVLGEALAEALPKQPDVPTKPVKTGQSNGHRSSGSPSRTSTSVLASSGTE